MKLRKDEIVSDGLGAFYPVNNDKGISILTTRSKEIRLIGLIDVAKSHTDWMKPNGLWYLENITEGDDCEILNTDSLMILVAQEEHGYVRA